MKAKQRTLAFLLALVLAAGAALALLTHANQKAEQAASEAEDGSIPLLDVTAATLESISIQYGGETLTLRPSDDGWTLTEDPAYHLDDSACSTIRTALAGMKAKRQLEAQPGEDYGLADPAVTVTVTAAGETNTFAFGTENPVTGDLYVQKAGDDAVYTVSGNKAACFELTKADIFGTFNPAELTVSALESVSITTGSGTLALNAVSEPAEAESDSSESAADSTTYQTVWRLADEPSADLDDSKVQSILSALAGYVTAQITDADPSAYGFDAPLATVRAASADGTVTIHYAENADGCWMMVEGDSSVYAVDLDTVQALLITATALKAE